MSQVVLDSSEPNTTLRHEDRQLIRAVQRNRTLHTKLNYKDRDAAQQKAESQGKIMQMIYSFVLFLAFVWRVRHQRECAGPHLQSRNDMVNNDQANDLVFSCDTMLMLS